MERRNCGWMVASDNHNARSQSIPDVLRRCGLAFSAFVAIGSLAWPQGTDEAVFAWVGGVLLDGGVPYRDAWDVKGPLTHYLYAVALALFGRNEISVRLFDLTAIVFSCCLLRQLVLRLNGSHSAGADLAVILFACAYYAGGYDATAVSDDWATVLVISAVVVLCRSTSRPHLTNMIVGVIVGLSALVKQTYFLYIILPFIYQFDRETPRSWSLQLLLPSVMALSIVGGALVFLYCEHALGDFIGILRFLLTSYALVDASDQQRHFLFELLGIPLNLFYRGLLVPFCVALFGLYLMRWRNQPRETRLLVSWFALATLTVVLQGKYWPEHWFQAVPPIAVSCGLAFTYASRWDYLLHAVRQRTYISSAIFLITILPSAVLAVMANYAWPAYAIGVLTRDQYVVRSTTLWTYPSISRLAVYLKENTRPGERIASWGFDPWIFAMSGRKSATRFGFFEPLTTKGPFLDTYRAIFIHEISHPPAQCIVINTRGGWFLPEGDGVKSLREFPAFEQLLTSRYSRVKQIYPYEVWKLVR